VAAPTLEVWRDAGVIAVLAGTADPAMLPALIQAADAVPRPREPAERERREATVPAVRPQLDDEDEDGD